jgi:hypothetical protein
MITLASESQREAAGPADEKPDGQAENSFVERTRLFNPCYTNWLLNTQAQATQPAPQNDEY